MAFKVPEKYRVTYSFLASTAADGNNGAFIIKVRHNQQLKVIASDQMGWEHVSVSRDDRCPTWEEMCQVKEMFWGDDDCVIQYHPPKADYINNHPYCLHLWRPIIDEMPMPPSIMVGIKSRQPKHEPHPHVHYAE